MKEFFSVYGAMLGRSVLVHLGYVLLSVAAGFILGLLLGILLSRLPARWSAVLLPILSVFQTIPGIVFIGLLFLELGMTPATVLIALSVYATFPVLKNTYVGLTQVEPRYLEAARGCGMSPAQALTRVELPLALPTIIGGLRLSTIYTVSWAVLASMRTLQFRDLAEQVLEAVPAVGSQEKICCRHVVPSKFRSPPDYAGAFKPDSDSRKFFRIISRLFIAFLQARQFHA